MKTITKSYDVYTYDELSKEAKERALRDWNRENDYPFLQADLREYLHEELTEAGYSHGEITPLYDLSYSQGSGLMFEGDVTDKDGNTFTIKHRGHYYHAHSTSISGEDKDGNEIVDVSDFEEGFFVPLCARIAQRGRKEIEWMESEEYFIDTCEANGYTFLSDGKMFN